MAKTMDEVFDQVTLWRGDLFAERSIVALVGEDGGRPLDPDVLTARGRELVDEDLATDVPPERDPYLAELDARQHGYVHAGRSYSDFRFLDGTGHPEDAEPWLDEFLRRSPPDARGREDLSPARRMLPRLDAPVPGAAASR